jgi:RNA recognition motif-containing protein
MNQQQPQQHPKEVFCGNLSFFCQESDLFQLFQDYARVRSVRVIRNQERTKSLMFGFVRFETTAEAEEMARVFNGQMFLGRRIK